MRLAKMRFIQATCSGFITQARNTTDFCASQASTGFQASSIARGSVVGLR